MKKKIFDVLYKGLVRCYGYYLRIISPLKDAIARHYLKKLKNKKNDKDVIKVGFCAECPSIWDKVAPIFDLMIKDSRFQVLLVFTKTKYTNSEEEFEEVQQFFKDLYPGVKYIVNNDINLADYNLDYFFYQRPYNSLFPANLRVEKVRKHSKICYVPYGYSGSNVFLDMATDKLFFRNVYFGFIEIEEELRLFRKKFKKTIENGYQFFIKLGYPSFERYLDFPQRDFSGTVLWTPRWTTDDKVGGSHFFDYKDDFLRAAKNIDFVFRPHPLMFDNFVKTGIMSESEVAKYKESLKEVGVKFSVGEQIEKDFLNSDILLTDYSSIIVEYFLTGKPIIYCKAGYELNEAYSNLMKGIYIADSWDDVMKYMDILLKGEDPLKEERMRIIRERYSDVKGAAERIVQRIVDDYNGN